MESILNSIKYRHLLSAMREYGDEACPYLDGEVETLSLVRCPWMPSDIHGALMAQGYRHSGDIFYIPACRACKKCLPIRVPVATFKPSKKQRHIFNKNRDVEIVIQVPRPTHEKFDLYRRYLAFQHKGKQAEDVNYHGFTKFLYQLHESSAEIQYWIEGRLAGITIADIISGVGLSSVYHFFEPDFASRSIGVFSVLAEIKLCEKFCAPYYYLGFWIPECDKMKYKANYRPNEILKDGKWIENPFL